jgi:hypothetical protein
MTLSHGADFSIELGASSIDVAVYKTVGNETKLVIVAPAGEELFSYTGDFEITDMIVANSSSQVAVNMPTAFGLSAAYPNPFNPSTSISLHVPMEGDVNVQVYDLSGRAVTTLLSGVQVQGDYNLTWTASEQASGMYLVRAETAGAVAVQKILLLK